MYSSFGSFDAGFNHNAPWFRVYCESGSIETLPVLTPIFLLFLPPSLLSAPCSLVFLIIMVIIMRIMMKIIQFNFVNKLFATIYLFHPFRTLRSHWNFIHLLQVSCHPLLCSHFSFCSLLSAPSSLLSALRLYSHSQLATSPSSISDLTGTQLMFCLSVQWLSRYKPSESVINHSLLVFFFQFMLH